MVDAAFYGDDFTGSTDALAQFTRLGFRGVLLVTMPSPAELRALAEQYDVIGVAGVARSLAPSEQEAELRPILTALRDLGPRVVQYKVCSTADSSPTLGSLGRALEVGRSLFGPTVVPILVAQPELGRYTVFSHHFAAEAGTVYRLDRQPTMSTHPATPMHESDLRVHLASQTSLRIGAIQLTSYADLPTHYAQSTDDALVLDALTDADLHTIGRTVLTSSPTPAFAIGSGGLSRALATALTSPPVIPAPSATPTPLTDQVLVVSGSQSRRTAEQIAHAVSSGWRSLTLKDPSAAALEAVRALNDGTPGVVVHTGRASSDLLSDPGDLLTALSRDLAAVVREVVSTTRVRRVLVAGGDTSGRVLRNLGINALEPLPNHLGQGLALCTAITTDPHLNGVHFLLKGGQIGPPDLFDSLRHA